MLRNLYLGNGPARQLVVGSDKGRDCGDGEKWVDLRDMLEAKVIGFTVKLIGFV
jgi:hypothetical protein